MKAKRLSDLLKAGDRVAVSNITGREASSVTADSQAWCGNVVGGWALGKGGERIEVPGGEPVPVFATVAELFKELPADQRNAILEKLRQQGAGGGKPAREKAEPAP